jgi:hypothetical protein
LLPHCWKHTENGTESRELLEQSLLDSVADSALQAREITLQLPAPKSGGHRSACPLPTVWLDCPVQSQLYQAIHQLTLARRSLAAAGHVAAASVSCVKWALVESPAITDKVCELHFDTFLKLLLMHEPLKFTFLKEQPQ